MPWEVGLKLANRLLIRCRIRIYTSFQLAIPEVSGIRQIKSGPQIQILLALISRMKELHTTHVEIIIQSLKQNNLSLQHADYFSETAEY